MSAGIRQAVEEVEVIGVLDLVLVATAADLVANHSESTLVEAGQAEGGEDLAGGFFDCVVAHLDYMLSDSKRVARTFLGKSRTGHARKKVSERDRRGVVFPGG